MKYLAILLIISFSVFSCRPTNDFETIASESTVMAVLQEPEFGHEDSLWMVWERQLNRLMQTHQASTGFGLRPKGFEKASVFERISVQLDALEQLLAEYRLIHGELSADLWVERRGYAQLEKEFDRKNRELQSLQCEMENIERSIDALQTALNNSKQRNDSLVSKLNRVYFAYGTADELHQADVVKIRPGWWTSAGRVKLKKNLNTSYFSPADQRQFKELPLFSDNAEVLTPHSPGSYEIVNDASGALLVITDSEKFWEQSRYLAVKVD